MTWVLPSYQDLRKELLMRIFPILLLHLLALSSFAQFFSGEITYRTTIIPKGEVVLDTTVTNRHNQVSTYIIKAGKYKSTYLTEGEESYSYTYNNKGKRMYDVRKGEKYITYRDSRKGNTTNKSSQIFRDSLTTILGYPCFVVHTEADYGFVRTYYSDSVQVDYRDFEQHAVGNWYEELKAVNGSITIKSITEFEDYTSVMEAIKIERRAVEDPEFALPEIPTVANYQSLDERVVLSPLSEGQLACYQKALKKAAKIRGRTGDHTVYLRFVLTESNQVKFARVYNPSEFGLDEIALGILADCGLAFKAGKIGGNAVSSEVFFPVEFKQ